MKENEDGIAPHAPPHAGLYSVLGLPLKMFALEFQEHLEHSPVFASFAGRDERGAPSLLPTSVAEPWLTCAPDCPPGPGTSGGGAGGL